MSDETLGNRSESITKLQNHKAQKPFRRRQCVNPTYCSKSVTWKFGTWPHGKIVSYSYTATHTKFFIKIFWTAVLKKCYLVLICDKLYTTLYQELISCAQKHMKKQAEFSKKLRKCSKEDFILTIILLANNCCKMQCTNPLPEVRYIPCSISNTVFL